MIRARRCSTLVLVASCGLLGTPFVRAWAEDPSGAAQPAPAGRAFETPEEGGRALLAAFLANDDAALRAVLGTGSEDLVEDGRDAVVAQRRAEVARSGAEKLAVVTDAAGRTLLALGNDGWPFPVPLVRTAEGWRFDAAAGREEMLARVIGSHELEAIGFAWAYGEMQEAYFAQDRDGDGVREYAQHLMSRDGRRDGLWWPSQDPADPSPMADVLDIPDVTESGPDMGAPFGGYYWRTLRAQGEHAPGGAYDYVLNGNMVAGYAIVAWPAEYRKTGVMTFLYSRNGVLYQKDLGVETSSLAKRLKTFDPDSTWQVVEPGKEVPAVDPKAAAPGR